MIRAVIDANVFVSGLLRPEGPCGRILLTALEDPPRIRIVMTASIAQEVRTALRYPKVLKHLRSRIDPAQWFDDYELLADLIDEPARLRRVCRDPDDDKYLAAALAGRADFLVSGDSDLASLGEHEGIRIVSPASFLRLF